MSSTIYSNHWQYLYFEEPDLIHFCNFSVFTVVLCFFSTFFFKNLFNILIAQWGKHNAFYLVFVIYFVISLSG